jgi:iron complex outermembrane receptor protein
MRSTDRILPLSGSRQQHLEFPVPGLQFGNGGIDGSPIRLRSISSVRAYTRDDSAVAAHMNGVFLPYSGLALGTLFDVERIGVLKGPQGTL